MTSFAEQAPCYRIIPAAGSDRLIVFFSATGKKNGKFDFWRVGNLLDVNVLMINNGRNAWYQDGVPGLGDTLDEVVASIQAIAAQLGATKLYTAGTSMGGYAAILFGCHLPGATVLTFGFDSLLKLPESRSAKQLHADVEVRYGDLKPVIENAPSKPRIFSYIGEMDPLDVVAIDRVAHLDGVNVVTLRGVGHAGARYIEAAFGLIEFVRLFVHDQPLPDFPARGTVLERAGLADLVYAAHKFEMSGELRRAERNAQEAVRRAPYLEVAHFQLGKALFKQKRYAEALPSFALISAMCPHFPFGRYFLAQSLRLQKNPVQALSVAQEALAADPTFARHHYVVAMSQRDIGRPAEAAAAAREACRLEPTNTTFANLLSTFEAAA